MSQPLRLLLVSKDLMLGSQLRGAAEQADLEFYTALSSQGAASRLAEMEFVAILVDLDLEQIEWEPLRGATVGEHRAALIAYGPHVHTAKLEAAKAAGCDAVFTRGQLAQSAPQILSQIVDAYRSATAR